MKDVTLKRPLIPLKTSFLFLAVFVLAKASAFLAPLFFSNAAASLEDYGVFEYALTFGVMASIVIDAGGNGAYPYFFFNKKEHSASPFYFHYLVVFVCCAALLGLDMVFDLFEIKTRLAILVAVIAGMQTRLSTIFKTESMILRSVVADGGLFFVINLHLCYLLAIRGSLNMQHVYLVFSCYAVLLFGFYVERFNRFRDSFSFGGYREIIRHGSRIVVSSFLIIGLTGSARVIIEHLVNTEEVGRYGFYFRLASCLVLIHQAVNTFFFKKIYSTSPLALNKYLSWFLVFILCASIIVWMLIPGIFPDVLVILRTYGHADKLIFLLMCAHVFYWISLAVYENLIYRENAAASMNRLFLLILSGFIGSCLLFYQLGELDTRLVCLLNVCCLFLCTEVQYFCLVKKNLVFGRLRAINILALVIFSTIYVALTI